MLPLQGLQSVNPPETICALPADWSPDGRQVLATSKEGLRIWDARTGKLVHSLPLRKSPSAAAWSRDGRWVAATEKDAAPNYLWDLASSVVRTITEKDAAPIYLWDLASGVVRTITAPAAVKGLGTLSFSPDGQLLAAACVNGEVHFWDMGGAPVGAPLVEKKRDEDQAMADLHQAVAAGFRDVSRLSTARELAELRSRQDFRELIDKLPKMPSDSISVPVVEASSVDGSKKQSQ
jgi:Tol biopolymer transport system component